MSYMGKRKLTFEAFRTEAILFSRAMSSNYDQSLYGVTDGKAVGTHLEHKFQSYLKERYDYVEGNSARGIDFPDLEVDLKVTSIKQPQSSCPFKSARQKIYGLGYGLLIFVYEKEDDVSKRASRLNILHVIFVESCRTADFQLTTGLREILENEGNKDDILAFFEEKLLPVDAIEAERLAQEVMVNKPEVGYLTISNALQWRLQYRRVIDKANTVSGVVAL